MVTTIEEIRTIGELHDSSPLMGDRSALDKALARDGYLYLRGVIDREPVLAARQEMMEILRGLGIVRPDTDEPVWTGQVADGIGRFGTNQFRAELGHARIWERLVEQPGVLDVLEAAVGEGIRFLPLAEYRSTAPGDATVIHQDGKYNHGLEMHTAWFPLMEIGEELGGLAIAPGTHGQGYLPLSESLPCIEPDTLPMSAWHRADYAPGDVVIFPDTTVHFGLQNRSADLLRLSIEVRFQVASVPSAVIGPVLEVSPSRMTVLDDSGPVTLSLTDDSYIRTRLGFRIPREEAGTSELRIGATVMVSQKDGAAVSVRLQTPFREHSS